MVVIGLKNLCTPAYVYLVISIISIVVVGIQNMYNYNNTIYCVGNYTCDTYSVINIFIIKMVYVLFWTWILNIICYYISSSVSWLLILVPYLLMFIGISFSFLNQVQFAKYLPNWNLSYLFGA